MKNKLLVTTAALAVMVSAGAYAQSRSTDTDSDRPAATQNHSDRNSGTKEMNRTNTRDTDRTNRPQTTGQAPARGDAATDSKTGNDPNAGKPAAQDNTRQPGNAAQSEQNTKTNAAQQDNKAPPSARSNQANEPRNSRSNSADQGDRNQPAAAQRDTDTQGRNRETANDTRTQSGTRVSASLQGEQRTRLDRAITRLDTKPIRNVNFSVSVGTTVPRSVSLHRVPTSIVSVVPQYRDYNYFLVRDQVVIVEPRTHRIVDVIEHRGPARASTTTRERRVNLSERQRSYIREHAAPRRTTTTTTGAAPRRQTIIVGEEVPQSVEIESFPEDVYREVPVVREYRYIRSGGDIYLVDPGSRRVIEEIE